MKIVCIGWGSLIWEPKNLLIEKEWYEDGPPLPIEFSRQSQNNRLTLTITPNVKEVTTLWAKMNTNNLNLAIESLKLREGILDKNVEKHIGSITMNELPVDNTQEKILFWAKEHKIDAVIWTNLPPKFNNEQRPPTIEEAILFINNLDKESNNRAIEYINNAPSQIDTEYRKSFHNKLIKKVNS